MSGCGCSQSPAVSVSAGLDASGNSEPLLEQWYGPTSEGPAQVSSEEAFLAMIEGGVTLDDEALAQSELSLVESEEDLLAIQELNEATIEAEPGELCLSDILELVRARPGLKITLSY